MIKITHFFFLLILLSSQTQYSQGVNPNFDFTGVDQFWKIVNTLEVNKDPSSSEWNRLFNTPGYNVLTNGEFNRDFFKKYFSLVFMPSQKNELNKALKQRKNIHHLQHYIKVRDNKHLINEQLKKLKRQRFNKNAVNRTLEFLPQRSVNQYPPVSFLIFESNGRGSSPIVVDIAASIEWDFMSFLSHEFHHWYRNRQLKYYYRKIKHDDADIVNTLASIEAEGIADMVDKKDWFTKSSNATSKYARQFINDVGRTPYVIQSMDKILKEIKNNPKDKRVLGRKLRNLLPQKGHTTGYFMASLILEKIGKRELVKCVGNPFEFVKLYNVAAKRTNNRYPMFSDQAMKLIDLLNKEYIKH